MSRKDSALLNVVAWAVATKHVLPTFLGELAVLVPLDDHGYRRLVNPIAYVRADGQHYLVPTGFITDYASVPRILWAILSPTGHHTYAAVLHDYLYQRPGDLDRKTVDGIFLEAMLSARTPTVLAHMMYLGVRLGGWVTWNKYRSVDTAR